METVESKVAERVETMVELWKEDSMVELAYTISCVYSSLDMRYISAVMTEFKRRTETALSEETK